MDPDATLAELRELYNDMQDGLPIDGEYVLMLFDALDTWMTTGGYIPQEWSR